MKSFDELTPTGRLRRMRNLARAALTSYGLPDAQIRFLRQAGNTLFRVSEATPPPSCKDDVYARGQYMLRIHQPGYQKRESIELELAWLAAMSREADLPVPEPVQTLNGRLLTQAAIPGIPGVRDCSLLRWVKGREIKIRNVRPDHYRAQGQLMAHLHNHAQHWQAPPGLTKRKYDWDGLFMDDSGGGMPAREAWSLLPGEYLHPFQVVAEKTRQVMNELGKDPAAYGLIHADLGLDANILFWKEEARAIDFDDSGFGYYLYDLSLALEHCQEDKSLPLYRDSLLSGYGQIRPLPADPIKYLDLFLAAFCVYMSLWAAGMIHFDPRYRAELTRRMKRAFGMVRHLNT